MTLKKLQQRINEAIAENERRGWHERNDMPVLISIRRDTKRYLHTYLPAEFLQEGQYTVGGQHFGCTITARETDKVKIGEAR